MSVHSRIIEGVAARATARAVHLVMHRMRALDGPRLSGADSGLRNAWEEVCVQVQVEHSIFWAEYMATMNQFASEAIERMAHDERCAVWLQTDQGEQWEDEVEERRESGDRSLDERPTYNHEDVVDHIVQATCDLAANWSNRRIRAHNERATMTD